MQRTLTAKGKLKIRLHYFVDQAVKAVRISFHIYAMAKAVAASFFMALCIVTSVAELNLPLAP